MIKISKITIKITETLQLEFLYDDINGKSKTKLLFKFNAKNSNWLYKKLDSKTIPKLIKSLKIIPSKINGIVNKNSQKKLK